jgi:RHS repeat-associated protein
VRTYDTDGKVTQIDSAGLKTYAYDDAFRITGITDTVNGANSYTYGYDALDRLTSAVKTGTTRGWTYDANGNRLTETGASASTYTISGTNNRVSSITGALPRTYTYDAAGNVLTYATVTATYNNRGRMKTLKKGSSTETIVWNALGQRVKVSGGTPGTVLYWYDEAGHLLGEYSSTGALVEETIWMGDIPVATIRPGTPAVVYYVHTDHLNTPRRVTRPSDNKLMWTWYADPFGSELPNENPASGGTFKYNLRFPGQLYDSHAGLSQNYFRDYDPAIGRYVESDPVGLYGGLNTYLYGLANPNQESDKFGLCPWCLAIPLVCADGGCEALAVLFGGTVALSTPKGRRAAEEATEAAIGSLKKCFKDDDQCEKVLDKALLMRAGIYGLEHEVKAEHLGTYKSLSLFDLCGCKDGRVVIKAHGCKGPIVAETRLRWK